MKKTNLFLLLLFSFLNCFGEDVQRFNFQIDGTINADSGKIFLHFYPDYTTSATKIMADVKDNKFSITGYIPESQGVFITLDSTYISSQFVIDEGQQAIVVNIDSVWEMPNVINKTMLTEYPNYLAFYKNLETKKELFHLQIDSLQKIYNHNLPSSIKLALDKEQRTLDNISDNTLLEYVQKNPDSKIAFWNLIRLMNWGYEPIFKSIYDTFSEEIKNGYAGKKLKNKLKNGTQLSKGKPFSFFNCQNTNGENLSPDIFLKNKFTLVDFWYSRCTPCLRQFKQMKDLYNQYNGKGFEIIGISVDQIEDEERWLNVISKEKLVWKQYWDKNASEALKFSIKAFPTNFLIDSSGRIIQKNISMEELDKVLKDNLTTSVYEE